MAQATMAKPTKKVSPSKNGSTAKAKKMTYYFGKTKTEGRGVSKEILGGKGANLAEMTSIGLPVPPGFTITTQVCAAYYDAGKKLPEAKEPAQDEKIFGALARLPSQPENQPIRQIKNRQDLKRSKRQRQNEASQ